MTNTRTLLTTVCLAAVACTMATAARADTAPFSDTGLPWTEPSHRSPLELLAGAVASTIAARPVSIRCQGDNDWSVLASQSAFDTARVWGYVEWRAYTSGAIHSISEFAQLSPQACLALQNFALAAPTKPTKCATSRTVTVTTAQVVSQRQRVRVAVTKLVKGKQTRTTVLTWRTVRQTVPVRSTKTEPGAPAPCFANDVRANASDATYWNRYESYAFALQTLAHEAVHLGGMVGGTLRNGVASGHPDSEARADCYGMQWLPYVAQQLGAAPDDAQAIARYYATVTYPRRQQQSPAYWSAECRDGGALDLRPDTNVWP